MVATHPSLRSLVRVAEYSALKGRALLWLAGLGRALPIENGVTLHRAEYTTLGVDGTATWASGLIAIPATDHIRGIVSYQHATRTHRADVPSTPSRTEGVLASLAFGGHGCIVVGADYLGLGTSPGPHPYLHAATEARAVIDLLRVLPSVLQDQRRQLPQDLLMLGFSQGGHASLAAQRALEAQKPAGLTVTATASIAGVYALGERTFPYALDGRSPMHALYTGYIAHAYAAIYGEPIESLLEAPWCDIVPSLYDGSKALADVVKVLPQSARAMLTKDVLADVTGPMQGWFARAMLENGVADWVPRAPVRLYYGTNDVDSPAHDAIETARAMARRGAAVEAISVEAADHNATAFNAVPIARRWFDELLERG